MIPNVLADRYASREMTAIFHPENRVRTERTFWLAVLEAQIDLGLEVDPAVLDDYRKVLDTVDLESIRQREIVTRHDVKARLEEFCDLAGHEHLHKGLTSRDATENVEQLLTFQGLELVIGRATALAVALGELADRYAALTIVGRTHNVPAQPTTLGKRFAMVGEELVAAIETLTSIRDRFALRGIKGPVGSQQDQLDLLGSAEAVADLEQRVADHLGVPRTLGAVGQVYPRSLDFEVVSALLQVASAPANLAITIRLMAGQELATEGFKEGQVGSSAMPHKMNTRSCERINGLTTILRGHVAMASGLVGDQWNEGDVSCSVVRRVVLPDAFFAIDGLLETTFAVVREFGAFEAVIEDELTRYLPFVSTTALLMHAVRSGLGREAAHEIIKTHAVAAALAMRGQGDGGGSLVERLGADDGFPGSETEIAEIVADPSGLLGLIDRQIASYVATATTWAARNPEAATYRGAEIL